MADIKTSKKNLEGDKVELEVEIPVEEIKAQVNRTIRELGKGLKMPGFRPGKVPRAVLVSRFGKDAIHAHALEDALPGWYEAAVRQSGIKAIDQPEIDFEQIEDDDKPYTFKATVAVMPRPVLGKYTGLEVEKDVPGVNDAEIDEEVDRLRKRMARLEDIEGRPAAAGDFVLIDFTGYTDGEPLEGGAGKDYMLELGSGAFIPGFEDQIEGLEKGQSKKLKLDFPETYKPEELAGKEAEFDVTVKEIKERVLPEADDAFAADNSEFDTIAELRDDIRARILKSREAAAERAFQQRVLQKLMEDVELAVPEAMIGSRATRIEHEFVYSMQAQGASVKEYLEQTDEQRKAFTDHFHEQAEAVIKQELVLEAIAEAEGIEVTDEEFMEEVNRAAESLGKDPEALLAQAREQEHEQEIRDDLLHQKALKALADKAIPVLKKASAAKVDPAEEAVAPAEQTQAQAGLEARKEARADKKE